MPAEEIHFGDEHWLDRDYYAVAPCWASAERAQSAPRGRRSPCVEVLLALIEHARGRHRVPVQAVVCATGDVAYSLPSRSWIRPARRWRCTAMPIWFGRFGCRRRSNCPHGHPRPRAADKSSHEQVSGTRTQRTESGRARPGPGYRQDPTGTLPSVPQRFALSRCSAARPPTTSPPTHLDEGFCVNLIAPRSF